MICVTLITLSVISCGTNPGSIDQINSYINDPDNGLTHKVSQGTTEARLTYRPSDFFLIQETKEASSREESDRIKQKYRDLDYFLLDLSVNDQSALYTSGSSYSRFSTNLNTLSYKLNDFAYIITSGGETIKVLDSIFPRTYGMSPSVQILFAFKNTGYAKSDWIEFHLDEFGLNTGNLRFRFDMEDINETPKMSS